MKSTFTPVSTRAVMARLGAANEEFARRYPGDRPDRQPIQTVYGGAQIFKADTAAKLGAVALRAMEDHGADFATFARGLGLPGADDLPVGKALAALMRRLEKQPAAVRKTHPQAWLLHAIHGRVLEKLRREPIEDFRIDFEDGYGNRPDAEEDGHAAFTAQEVARGMAANSLPPFLGIRTKPLTQELRHRAVRTLDVFMSTLLAETGGRLPENFVITIPKVVLEEQVQAFVELLVLLERKHRLPAGTLKVELMIETPQSILNPRGEVNIPRLVEAAGGRCVSAHFGVYDYTASNNITAAYQIMTHPVCDFAREMMRVSLAGTGVWISDGATNIMPVGPHRAPPGGRLAPAQKKQNTEVIHRAWQIMHGHVQHSLETGFYQGWDLHPAQFPVRYATVYHFFLAGLESASLRLKTFIEKAAQATLIGDVFDDAATGQGLLNYFLRGINCGAITEEEAQVTGLSIEELHARSFVKILEARRVRG